MRKVILAAACFALISSAANAADLLYISEFNQPGITRGYPVQIAQQSSHDQVTADFTSSPQQSATFQAGTNIVRLLCTAQCSVLFGTNPTASNVNMVLPALTPEYFAVPQGQNFKVSVSANP